MKNPKNPPELGLSLQHFGQGDGKSRIGRGDLMMHTAELWSHRSTCLRLKVGAVIAVDNRPVSQGYNGAPSGIPHCDETNCGPNHKCDRTIHAEMNAIVFAAKHGISIEGGTLYTTHAPCLDCAKAIVNSGIKTVFYKNEYRSKRGLDFLLEAGVQHYQLWYN